MSARAICEPIPLPPSQALAVDKVRHTARSRASDRFVHFHDALELVLFERVAGAFRVEGTTHELTDHCLILAPSMAVHDFALEPGAKAWTLLQLAPFLAQAAVGEDYAGLLTRPACVAFDAADWRRAQMTFDWLNDVAADETQHALAITLIRSIFGLIATHAPAQPAPASSPAALARLRPALERLHARPGETLSAAEAASLCSMSGAYFSRTFKAVIGRTYSDYEADYRLLLAAHRIIAEADPLSRIAFETGFANPSHFAARFRERFGISPRAYRKAGRDRMGPTGRGN